MKLGVIPENMLERVARASGVVPTPLFDTLGAMMLARTIMAANKLGVFEALASGLLPAHQVAAHCSTDPGWKARRSSLWGLDCVTMRPVPANEMSRMPFMRPAVPLQTETSYFLRRTRERRRN
jgi:hypothetical protein